METETETEGAEKIEHLKQSLRRLRAARDSGALQVRHGDTSTTFRSVTELQTAITINEQDLQRANGVVRTRSFRIYSRKGY